MQNTKFKSILVLSIALLSLVFMVSAKKAPSSKNQNCSNNQHCSKNVEKECKNNAPKHIDELINLTSKVTNLSVDKVKEELKSGKKCCQIAKEANKLDVFKSELIKLKTKGITEKSAKMIKMIEEKINACDGSGECCKDKKGNCPKDKGAKPEKHRKK